MLVKRRNEYKKNEIDTIQFLERNFDTVVFLAGF